MAKKAKRNTKNAEATTAGSAPESKASESNVAVTARRGKGNRPASKRRSPKRSASAARRTGRPGRRRRRRYSTADRTRILAAARQQGLTAKQVQQKFGVTPVTYYSWRKKSGTSGPSQRRGNARVPSVRVDGGFRSQLERLVRDAAKESVRAEVASYLNQVFGGGKARGR